MKLKTITDTAANKLKTPKTGQLDYFDGAYPGLALRVSHGGRKSWVYFYRIGGKLKRFTFGSFPAMTVAAAHDEWRKASGMVAAKKDPAQARKTPDAGRTDFGGVAKEWLKRDQAQNRSHKVVEQTLARKVLPHWEHRQITDISRRDVLDLIDGIADNGTVILARRVHASLHRLFAWAVGRGIVEINPLTNLPKPGSETRRDRVLTEDELVKVWRSAEKLGWPYGAAFRMLILTSARREEIGQLRWSEIVGDTINLEGARTKNGEPHIIPVSTPALTLLDQSPRIADSDFVFTISGKSPLARWSGPKADLDDLAQIAPWRTHDLRRTTATGLQKLGVALQVTEAVLGHTAGSRTGVVGIYQRHDYATEKRAALEAWGAHVMALVEGRAPGKVVPIRGKR
jgi:integrase